MVCCRELLGRCVNSSRRKGENKFTGMKKGELGRIGGREFGGDQKKSQAPSLDGVVRLRGELVCATGTGRGDGTGEVVRRTVKSGRNGRDLVACNDGFARLICFWGRERRGKQQSQRKRITIR